MEETIKKGINLIKSYQTAIDGSSSSTESEPLATVFSLERRISVEDVKAMKECVMSIFQQKPDDEQTFYECLYIVNTLNYPAIIEADMQAIVDGWELNRKKRTTRQRLIAFAMMAGVAVMAGAISWLIGLIP